MNEFNLKKNLAKIKKYHLNNYSVDNTKTKPFYNLYPYKPSIEFLNKLKEGVKNIKIIPMKVDYMHKPSWIKLKVKDKTKRKLSTGVTVPTWSAMLRLAHKSGK